MRPIFTGISCKIVISSSRDITILLLWLFRQSDLKLDKSTFKEKEKNALFSLNSKFLKIYWPVSQFENSFISSKGIDAGLKFVYTNRKDEFSNICGGMVPGLFIKLHPQGEIPSLIKIGAKVQIHNMAKILIKPKMLKSTKGLEKWTPEL